MNERAIILCEEGLGKKMKAAALTLEEERTKQEHRMLLGGDWMLPGKQSVVSPR